MDPKEDSVEESLATPRWRTPPGASSFFGWVVWGHSWVAAWGGVGVWVWVWVLFGGLGGGSGVGVAQAVRTRAGGGGALRATCWQCGGAGDRSPLLPHPSMRVARTLPRAAT